MTISDETTGSSNKDTMPHDITQVATVPEGALAPSRTLRQKIVREVNSWVMLIAIIVILRSSVFGHFLIPSPSMLPSIKTGDHVFANKLAYGLMLPFGETQILNWAKPLRGDIVLFKSKSQDITLIKRVVAIGGDVVSFRRGVLQINNTPVKEEPLSDRSILSDSLSLSDDKNLFQESGLGSRPDDTHYILRQKYNSFTESDTREFTVPDGYVFCMGDNRDDSNDSRFWGMLEVDKIYGKAMFITFSNDPSAPGILPKFREGRFLRTLH